MMKTLTKITVLALGLAAASAPVFAATADDAAPARADKRAHVHAKLAERRAKLRAHVAKRIELSAEQKTQLKAKRDELKSSLQTLKDDTALSKEQKRTKARELMQSARGNFRSVLNADQQKKLAEVREKVRARAHKRGPGKRPL